MRSVKRAEKRQRWHWSLPEFAQPGTALDVLSPLRFTFTGVYPRPGPVLGTWMEPGQIRLTLLLENSQPIGARRYTISHQSGAVGGQTPSIPKARTERDKFPLRRWEALPGGGGFEQSLEGRLGLHTKTGFPGRVFSVSKGMGVGRRFRVDP